MFSAARLFLDMFVDASLGFQADMVAWGAMSARVPL